MSEIEKGSEVTVQVHVKEARGGRFLITLGPGGMTRWIDARDLQPVEPPPFKVGDRVDAAANGKNRVIDRILTIYHLRDSPDNVTHTRDELTLVPPKPEYHVVRKDDELRLENSNGIAIARLSMENPNHVESVIVMWARDCGIDADAARKLASKPQVIDRYDHEPIHALAIRHAAGWCVWLTAYRRRELAFVMEHGTQQNDFIGKRIFPKIKGPYEEKP